MVFANVFLIDVVVLDVGQIDCIDTNVTNELCCYLGAATGAAYKEKDE